MSILETYRKEFKGALPSLKGGRKIAHAREEGMERFVFLGGIPGPRAEDWRYSDLGPLRSDYLKPQVNPPAQTVPDLDLLSKWPAIVVMNGALLEPHPKQRSVEILGTGAALEKFPAWAGDYVSPGVDDNPLERLNLAMAEGGVFIKIGKNAALKGLEIIFLEGGEKDNARHLRNFIRLEPGANLDLLVRTVSLKKNPGWTNMVTNILLGEGARLNLVSDFEQKGPSFLTGRTFVKVDAKASFSQVSLALGLNSHRFETEVALLGSGADADLAAGLLAGKGESVDFVTRVHHSSPGATSSQTVKAVAGKNGQTAFQGKVVVEENADKTEAHQKCSNLILEASGEANVKPELLIFADDVICSHGATVGEIDETALFYMMQRGIPEHEAKSILVRSFLGDVIEALEDAALHTYFEDKVSAWMKKNLGGGAV